MLFVYYLCDYGVSLFAKLLLQEGLVNRSVIG